MIKETSFDGLNITLKFYLCFWSRGEDFHFTLSKWRWLGAFLLLQNRESNQMFGHHNRFVGPNPDVRTLNLFNCLTGLRGGRKRRISSGTENRLTKKLKDKWSHSYHIYWLYILKWLVTLQWTTSFCASIVKGFNQTKQINFQNPSKLILSYLVCWEFHLQTSSVELGVHHGSQKIRMERARDFKKILE